MDFKMPKPFLRHCCERVHRGDLVGEVRHLLGGPVAELLLVHLAWEPTKFKSSSRKIKPMLGPWIKILHQSEFLEHRNPDTNWRVLLVRDQ